ncbi:MAG: hypothetical protein GY763_06930 [Gammaproteobacteria bacterium]|nr:hypothetical protein [Gammaproteobacteria bacterium]
MNDNDNIPVLTDLIKDNIDDGTVNVTLPELGLDIGQDMYIEEDDDPLVSLRIEPDRPLVEQPAPDVAAIDPKLEQTIRLILDEHMELAWQEIRLAIQLSQDDSI